MFRSALKMVGSCAGSTSPLGDDDSFHGPLRDRPLATDPTELAPAHVRAIEPYQVGKSAAELSREIGIPEAEIIKLASNENPYGMSPKASAAIVAAASGVTRYPDEFTLRCDLAKHHGLAPENVILTNGSDELIGTISRAFLGSGRASVMSDYAYLSYANATQAIGSRNITVPALDYGHDLAAMLRAITPDTRVVWVSNPNNPTGTFIQEPALRDFVRRVPRDVVVVLDEAYSDFLPEHLAPNSAAWVAEHPNMVVAKTFSKIHGLAGLRMGYGLASPKMVSTLMSVRQTYSCNALALAAAGASLRDRSFVDSCRSKNAEGIQTLNAGLEALGLKTLPAHGNFVAFELPDAGLVHQRLMKKGLIVRPLTQYSLPNFLRVSVGLPEQNQRFLDELSAVLSRKPVKTVCFELPAPEVKAVLPKREVDTLHPLHPAYVRPR